jgi:hypothetical protein
VKKKSSRTKALRKHRRQRDQELAHQVAERIRDATERSNTLGNYLPPPRCPARQQGGGGAREAGTVPLRQGR